MSNRNSKPQLKLPVHLVPAPLWRRSAYRMFNRDRRWKKIRKDALQQAENKCEVCNDSKHILYCHEIWEYQDRRCRARLVGFSILCESCHYVSHLGLARNRGREEVSRAHFRKVNHLTKREADALIEAAFDLWKVRGHKPWEIVIARPLLKKYPDLAGLKEYEGDWG